MANFMKVDVQTLMDGLANISRAVHGRKHDFLPSFIGSVEVVDGKVYYDDGDYDYETSFYLAAQLSNGPIVGVKDDSTVFALNNRHTQYTIHWGYYPKGFEDELKTKRECPKGLLPPFAVPTESSGGYAPIEIDELPT